MVSVKRARAWGAAGLVIACAVAVVIVAGRGPLAKGAPKRHAATWSLPVGQRATYELAWVGHRITPFGLGHASVDRREADVRLVARATIDALPSDAADVLVAMSLVSVSRAELHGSDLPEGVNDAAVTGLERTSCTVRGSLANASREVRCSATTPPAGEAIVRDLAAHALPTVRLDASAWMADEATRDVIGEVQYRWLGDGDLERRRSAPREMLAAGVRAKGRFSCRGEARWSFHESGFPARFVEREEWSEVQGPSAAPFALEQRIELRLIGVAPSPSAGGRVQVAATAATATEDVHQGSSVDERLLDQRIGSMTIARALADLDGLGAGGKVPDSAQWNVQVTGLLLKHPEYAAALAGAFATPVMNATTRNRIMELLASVGSEAAQAAMIDALAAPHAQLDRNAWAAHLERFALLRAPATDETMVALDGLWSRAASTLERACAASALATAASSRLSDATSRARAHLDDIARAAQYATDNEGKALLLRALGNARQPIVYEAVREAAKSSSTVVRAAAMTSLRHVDSEEARKLLLEGVRDAAFNVAGDAIESLRDQRLDAANYGALLDVTCEHAAPAQVQSSLVSLLALHVDDDARVRDALACIVNQRQEGAVVAAAQAALGRRR